MLKWVFNQFNLRKSEYRRPNIFGCVTGIILGAVVVVIASFFLNIFPFLMALGSSILLTVPDRLGLLPKITQTDVVILTVPQQGEFELNKPGKYTIFSPELLLIKQRTKYEVILQLKDTSEQVEVRPIIDGTSRFGAELVEGQPIFEFDVKQAGAYKIAIQNLYTGAVSSFILSIVPNYSTQYQNTFCLSCLVHSAIIGGIVWIIYYRRNRVRIETDKAIKKEKTDKLEAWLKKEKESKNNLKQDKQI